MVKARKRNLSYKKNFNRGITSNINICCTTEPE